MLDVLTYSDTHILIYSCELMHIIAVLNQKGGSGKTTIATNLARALQKRNRRVAIVDADPQGTSSEWAARQDGTPPVFASKEPTIHKDVPALEGSFDMVVIDGAPRLEAMATSAIKAAELVLIPVQPSAADIWAAEDIVDLIRVRQEVTGGLPRAAFVVSRQVVGSNLADTVQAALEAFDVPVLRARTSQRVAYAEALGAGLSVLDINAGKAEYEIQRLAEEALEQLNGVTLQAH